MYPSLKIPMMMYGRFQARKAKRDKDGNTIILRRDKKGRPVYKMENYWKVHSQENGDPGVYPSINRIYKRIMRGRQKLIKPAEDLMDLWATAAKMWMNDYGWEITDEKVIMEIVFHFPDDNIKRDTHNIDKLLMDSFKGVLYVDDDTVLPRIMDYHKVKNGEDPYLELTFYKKEDEDDILKERYRKFS